MGEAKHFLTALSWLETVTTCDLRHEWVTVYGVKKHLVLQPNWCFLMAFPISHGLLGGPGRLLYTCKTCYVHSLLANDIADITASAVHALS